ncbi:MAG: threonine ammonia-lyase [Planctomycetota bacterium]
MSVVARDVERAAEAIAGHVVRTPLVPSPRLSQQYGCTLSFKLENLQFTGSFKDRGSCLKLQQLRELPESSRGVVAASAGNHAQGVAFHAQRLLMNATIVMPQATPFSKVERTEALGATVLLHGESLSEAQQKAQELVHEHGLLFVHPYDDVSIIAGQGTVALEMLQDQPDLDILVAPIGGGGLIAGMSTWAKERHKDIQVIGVQTMLCPSMHAAVRGLKQPTLHTNTIAEGIAVKQPGAITTPIIQCCVDDILLVEEAAIEQAVQFLAAQLKVVAEGAAAAAFAAIQMNPARFTNKKVGVVISGGNIDRRMLSTVLLRGLRRDRKIARIRIEINDAPGVLSKVTRLVGATGADIIDITHQRIFSALPPRSAELTVEMETRGRPHVEQILAALRDAGFPAQNL